jgi:hypothetical protein
MGTAQSAAQFLFIVVVPLVMVAGALIGLFAIGAVFDALDHPGEIRERIESLFRSAPKPPVPVGADHYYRAYWSKP